MKPGQRAEIDMTSPGDSMEYTEVLTPGGIIRVGTGLTDTRTGQPVVLVEIEANSSYARHTAPGGHWNITTSQLTGTERRVVRLTRQKDS